MYSKPFSIEEFLFAYWTFYISAFPGDVFWKLNFYALSPVCNFFGEAKKTESLLALRHHYYSFTWRTFRNVHTFTETHAKTSNFDTSTCHFSFKQKIIYYLKKNYPRFSYQSSTVVAFTSSLLYNLVIGLFKIYSIFLRELLQISLKCTTQTLNFFKFSTRLDNFFKCFYAWSLSFPEIIIAIETRFLSFFCSFWKSQTNTALEQYIQVPISISLII